MPIPMQRAIIFAWLLSLGSAFTPIRSRTLGPRTAAQVFAESGGRGFGKAPATPSVASRPTPPPQPIEESEILASSDVESSVSSLDDGRSVEERQAEILRNFGLGKLEERKNSEQLVPGLNVDLPSDAFDSDGDLNLLAFIPIELQGTIESVLKFTTAVLLVAFILAGVAITWDAYAVATKGSLPESIANLIQNVIEPNFTPAGVLFLASSSSLGLFKLAQFSNPGVQYGVTNFDDIKEVE